MRAITVSSSGSIYILWTSRRKEVQEDLKTCLFKEVNLLMVVVNSN